jgi:putative transposase
MPNYRRRHVTGGTYFFTLVTENRHRILCTDLARPILRKAVADCARKHPFDLVAMVLLQDHLHAMWTLPKDDCDYPGRWARIKAQFTREWLNCGGQEHERSASRLLQRRRGIWQRKFWEHQIRDSTDYGRHLNYIHYNPVKHGFSQCPHQYEYSTFQKWVRRRVYAPDWGCVCDGKVIEPPSFDGLDLTAME